MGSAILDQFSDTYDGHVTQVSCYDHMNEYISPLNYQRCVTKLLNYHFTVSTYATKSINVVKKCSMRPVSRCIATVPIASSTLVVQSMLKYGSTVGSCCMNARRISCAIRAHSPRLLFVIANVIFSALATSCILALNSCCFCFSRFSCCSSCCCCSG